MSMVVVQSEVVLDVALVMQRAMSPSVRSVRVISQVI
jgi:hypothetical protein